MAELTREDVIGIVGIELTKLMPVIGETVTKVISTNNKKLEKDFIKLGLATQEELDRL